MYTNKTRGIQRRQGYKESTGGIQIRREVYTEDIEVYKEEKGIQRTQEVFKEDRGLQRRQSYTQKTGVYE